MTATFLLIRHAMHADFDIRLSGRRPGVALSPAGVAQAAALGRRLAAAGITRVVASPLERTMATAAAIAQGCGLAPPEPVEALTELDLGEWTGEALDALHDDPRWRVWNEQRGTACAPGGESMAEAAARITGWLRATAAAFPDQTIAVVTHSDMVRGAVAQVLGLPLDHLCSFDVDPASVSTVVMGDWGARLLNLNVTAG
ncbi:histidine phosphatase family protein [uncultured Sphingomonas sp.]|uniref:histidine phosphatase family protein n=1 Tax=uncultured Sphingomonas sp. TaxID=158754 RepID=UPI0035CA254A